LKKEEEPMTEKTAIKVLFLDVGGVLLTNGWDRHMRRRAAEKFGLDHEEMDERHHLTFDTYEEGKLTLEEYLRRVVFYEKRSFTPEEFKTFMFAQSEPLPEMIEFVRSLKRRFGLRIAAVSNEGRELTVHRVRKFNLTAWIDFFIASAFVHFRKPDHDIYRMALDIAQADPAQVLYIDDRAMFVDVARDLGIRGIHHRSFESTRKALESIGF
jgi:putative hydrolase of the HAD superfamily